MLKTLKTTLAVSALVLGAAAITTPANAVLMLEWEEGTGLGAGPLANVIADGGAGDLGATAGKITATIIAGGYNFELSAIGQSNQLAAIPGGGFSWMTSSLSGVTDAATVISLPGLTVRIYDGAFASPLGLVRVGTDVDYNAVPGGVATYASSFGQAGAFIAAGGTDTLFSAFHMVPVAFDLFHQWELLDPSGFGPDNSPINLAHTTAVRTTVPEPASLGLFGLGLMGLGALRRRKKIAA